MGHREQKNQKGGAALDLSPGPVRLSCPALSSPGIAFLPLASLPPHDLVFPTQDDALGQFPCREGPVVSTTICTEQVMALAFSGPLLLSVVSGPCSLAPPCPSPASVFPC